MTVSDTLRQALKDCGRSMYTVAQETGINASVLSRFVSGGAGLRSGNLDTLADFLDLELRPRIKAAKSRTPKGR